MSGWGISGRAASHWPAARHFLVFPLIGCLTVFSFAGCGNQTLSGSGIHSPVVINYVVNNPLNVEEHREGDGGKFGYEYITVSGLADEKTEQKINDRIKEVYDGLRIQDLPPYRGIKAEVSEDAKITGEQIYTNVMGNFNNILSIIFYKYTTYDNPGINYSEKDPEDWKQSVDVTEQETLNFDLNTGKEITLADLFCDGVDYMEFINEYMTRFLAESHSDDEGWYRGLYSGVKLVEPFKGLSKDQKFALSSNSIIFVFDYLTPQFQTDLTASDAWADFGKFGDNIAATERFYDKKNNIFTSEKPPVKSLVFKGSDDDMGGTESYQDGPIYVYQSWSYSSGLPKEIRNRLEEMKGVDQGAIDRAKKYFSGKTEAEIAANGGGDYEVSVNTNRIGNFINIYKSSGLYLPDTAVHTVENHCYDAATQKELSLVDIFAEGYDYKPVVMKAIRQAIKDYDEGSGKAGRTYSDEEYEAVFDRISGFQLNADAVGIDIGHPDGEAGNAYLNLYIPYTDFGCENLNIFR